jgi:hypothetical protein
MVWAIAVLLPIVMHCGITTGGAEMRLPYDDLSTRVEHSTGGVSSGSLEGFPASNAKLTRRAMFRFAAQFAPGLLMAVVTITPRSCRGAVAMVEYSAARLSRILCNGIPGSAMESSEPQQIFRRSQHTSGLLRLAGAQRDRVPSGLQELEVDRQHGPGRQSDPQSHAGERHRDQSDRRKPY